MDNGTASSVTVYPGVYFFMLIFVATIFGLVYLVIKRREVPRPLFITLLVVLILQVFAGLLSVFPLVDVVTHISSGEADDSGGE